MTARAAPSLGISLKEHHKTIAAAVALSTILLGGFTAAGWGFKSPETRLVALESRVEVIAATAARAASTADSSARGNGLMLEALLIDRCLDTSRTPADFARMRINCKRLLSQD